MALKRNLVRPTPSSVRSKLPRVTLNKETGEPMSTSTIYRIFVSRCYDDTDDDPWVFMPTLVKDYSPASMLPRRAFMRQHIKDNFRGAIWRNTVAIDICSSLFPTTVARIEEQRVAAMGKERLMSKKFKMRGCGGMPREAFAQMGELFFQLMFDLTQVVSNQRYIQAPCQAPAKHLPSAPIFQPSAPNHCKTIWKNTWRATLNFRPSTLFIILKGQM